MHPRAGPAELLDAAVRRGWITPRRARVVAIAGVPALVLGTLAWLVVAVLRTGGVAEPSVFAEFVDPAGNSYLDVQLDSSLRSYGAFSAVMPGQGRVWPTARVATTRAPGSGVELRYDGAGRRELEVQTGDRYEPVRPQSPPDTVRLRLVGQVDAARHVASVDVWVNGVRHHIGSAGQLTGAQDVVHDFLGAVLAQDWDEVYSIETASMRNGSKRGDFVTDMPNAGAVTKLSAARPVGPTTYSRTPAGVWYARTPVRFTYATGTAMTDVDATVVLVVEGGDWSVLSLE